MSALRWTLLVLGVAIIAAIYFVGRRKEQQESSIRREPALGHRDSIPAQTNLLEPDDGFVESEADPELIDFDDLIARGLETEVANFRPKKPPVSQTSTRHQENKNGTMLLDQELVVLNLFSATDQGFDGAELYAAFHNAGFSWKNDQLFHCQRLKGEYLALNALKPGTFPQEPVEFNTRAVALILQLSSVKKPVDAFDEFLMLARQLQQDLEARLCDGQRSSLTKQTIAYLHDEVQQYQFKHR
ncbi:MAG: hypothetical protein JXA04_08975 [Gammaproteobacteria bacterium]|nr:hypothetical protein [Gammaproteobacteria bacterium]